MNISSLGQALQEQMNTAMISAHKRTSLYSTADDNLGMADAYLKDGHQFLSSGDTVNALAAFSYALGWLHFGAAYGLFKIREGGCPFAEPFDRLPDTISGKLDEKTQRYKRLLDTARNAIRPAAEAGTVPHHTTCRILCVTAAYAGQGSRLLALGKREDALASFSYAHGWVDAGVRAGLFSIHGSREIFTV